MKNSSISKNKVLLKNGLGPFLVLIAVLLTTYAMRANESNWVLLYTYAAILLLSTLSLLIPNTSKIRWATLIKLVLVTLAFLAFEKYLSQVQVFPFEWFDLSAVVKEGFISATTPITNHSSSLWLLLPFALLCYFIPTIFRLPWVLAVFVIFFLVLLSLAFYQNGYPTTWSVVTFKAAFFAALLCHNSFTLNFQK